MASTTQAVRQFNDMLNEYLPNKLFNNEMLKRDYIMSSVPKDDGWKGGSLIVPFEGAQASSIEFGQLAADSDIAQDDFVRGSVSTYVDVWGSMKFNHMDLGEHGQGIPEKTFLKILPDRVERFMQNMKESVSVMLGTGPHFAKATANGDVSGNLTIDRIDRVHLGQKIVVDDDNSSAVTGYVRSINLNTSVIVVYDARTGGSVVDLSGYTTAQNAKLYYPGVLANSVQFSSVRSALLSAANGGSATLHGQTKTAYPFLQAINIDGSSINASNILEKIFDAYTTVRTRARGSANEILMSYKHLGSIMKLIEVQKGGFKVTPTSQKASLYGWDEIELTTVKGRLKLVAIQEWDDDVIAFIDWSCFKFYSNGMFKKRTAPDGKQFYELRATTGYSYIVDISLYGELVCLKPTGCGIIYGISY